MILSRPMCDQPDRGLKLCYQLDYQARYPRASDG